MFVWKSKAYVAQEKWDAGAYAYTKWFVADLFRSFLKATVGFIFASYAVTHWAQVKGFVSGIPGRIRGVVNSLKQNGR